MKTEIKKFEKMYKVKFKEHEFYLTEQQFNIFKSQMKEPGNIIEIGGDIFNKYNFEYSEQCRPTNDIDSFILQQPFYIRKVLIERELEKKKKIGRGFDSIEEVNNYMISKNLINNL